MSQQTNSCINKESLVYLQMAFSAIGVIIPSIYIYLFFRIPKLHKSPGDIYFGMSIAELIYAAHFLTYSAYIIAGIGLANMPLYLCVINQLAFSLAVLLIYSYILQLYMHMVVRLIYTLKQKKIQKWKGHVSSWIVAIAYSLMSQFFQDSGCGLGLTKYAPFTYVILLIGFYLLALSSKKYLEVEIGANEKVMKQGIKFLKYLKILFITQATIATTILFSTVTVYILQVVSAEMQCLEAILVLISQIFASQVPIIMPLARYADPFLQKRIKEYFQGDQPLQESAQQNQLEFPEYRAVRGSLDHSSSKDELQEQLLPSKKQYSLDDIQNKSRGNTLKSSRQKPSRTLEQESADPFIHQFSNQIRTEILKKILALILIQEMDKKEGNEKFYKKIKREGINGFDEQFIYTVDNVNLCLLFPEFFSCYNQEVTYKMTSHSVDTYQILIQNDLEKIDLTHCLDLALNQESILQCAQTTGGKSGQFFYFNHNNRILLKTISEYEMKVLFNIQENYFWHLNSHPDTTLAKILGIFTFEGFEVGRISLILMKNIGKINVNAYLATYDLKGSSYDREVLKQKKSQKFLPDTDINETKRKYSKVLKDIDFKKIEGNLHINPYDSDKLYQQLEEDTQFLKSQGLMDYSLCIIKVDWGDYYSNRESFQILDEQLMKEIIQKRISKLQHCYQCLIDDFVYYHVGIIDYLQTYTMNKKAEKYTKKLLKLNSQLDTSSQDPNKYRSRFLAFVKEIL